MSPTLLDLRGLKCPLPVLRTRKALARLPEGSLLVVRCTDPLSAIDIPHLCAEARHELVARESSADGHVFTIRKGSA